MLCTSYNNRYIITLIGFSFLLGIQENQAAEKAIMPSVESQQSKIKKMSESEQMALLKRLQGGLTEEQRRALTGGKVIAIIGKKEPEKIVKEISPIEKQLTDIERKLNSSLFVSQNDLKQISSELSGSVQKELNKLPQGDEETGSLRDKAIALAEQLGMFEGLMRVENAFHAGIHEKNIDNDMIAHVERELKNIQKRAGFLSKSSFNQRVADLEQLVKQQKNLLAMAPEQRAQEEVLKMESYLTVLENAFKNDDIKPEIVQIIRVNLNKMIDPKKLNFPDLQQRMITKRIRNLEQLLDIFDYLLHMQIVVQQKDLSAVMTEGVAAGLRNVQKELEQLDLPRELLISIKKHIAKVNDRLLPKLFKFLDQLARDVSEVISTLNQLKDAENRFKLLQKLRNSLDVTKEQNHYFAEKFAEIEMLLKQQRESLLEQQKRNQELERIEHEQRQIALQKEKELQEQKELLEREQQAEQEHKRAKQLEEQQKEEERIKKLYAREDAIKKLEKEILELVQGFVKLTGDWRKDQDQEANLRSSFYTRKEKPKEGEQDRLKRLERELEQKKNFMVSYEKKVEAIHNGITQLYKQSGYDKDDLVPLLNRWVRALWDLREQLVKESQALLSQTNQKKREKKSYSMPFIDRNEMVMKGIDDLIILVDRMRIADDNKLVLIEEAIKKRDMPRKAPKPKRQGAFSRYF